MTGYRCTATDAYKFMVDNNSIRMRAQAKVPVCVHYCGCYRNGLLEVIFYMSYVL